jgi:hypothetical protein
MTATPLHIAGGTAVEVVRVLLEHGANVGAKSTTEAEPVARSGRTG